MRSRSYRLALNFALKPIAEDTASARAEGALECGRSSYRLAINFAARPMVEGRYRLALNFAALATPEGGSCCDRTPRRFAQFHAKWGAAGACG